MATRPLISTLLTLRPSLTARPLRALTVRAFQRPISTSRPLYATSTASQPAETDSVAASMTQSASLSGQPSSDDDGRHAAFLGEADSNDGFEAWRDAYGKPHEAVDSANAAFLGEADSDDGFESHKDIHGVKLEAVDATQAAFLGEADSDDGFESDVEVNPDKYRHKLEDVSSSGEHGQPGEGDQ